MMENQLAPCNTLCLQSSLVSTHGGKPTQTSALGCHCWTRPRMLLLHCPVTSSPDPTACAYSNASAEVPPQIHPCSVSKSCSGSGRFGERHNKARVPRWAAQQHCPWVHHLDGIFPSPPKSTPSSSRLGRMGKSSP